MRDRLNLVPLASALFLACSSVQAAPKAKDIPTATPATSAAAKPVGPWKKQVVAKYTLGQSHFDNWAQGGEDTLSWQASLLGTFTRDGAKTTWKNGFRAVYGRSKTGGQVSTKTVDDLFAESVLTYKMAKWVNPFVSGNFQSQMDKGYASALGNQVQTSQFFDPGIFTEAAGAAYDSKKGFTTRLGGAAKETLTNRFPVTYTDDPSTPQIEKTRVEVGLTSVTEYKRKLGAQALFSTKVDIFSNLREAKQATARWSNLLTVKATKYLDMSTELELLYDGHVSTRRQLRQAMGLGLSYTLL